jgi:glucose/arabinose dehydrogenase
MRSLVTWSIPLAVMCFALLAGPASAQVELQEVVKLDDPLDVDAAPGDDARLFITEQDGVVWVLQDGRRLAAPFLDISDRVESGGEQGLLSLEFAPDYQASGRFYVLYTDNTGDVVLDEYRRSAETPDLADTGSRRRVLRQRHREASNHNGGALHFGPDGFLYVSIGDGGADSGRARSLRTLLGKLLRIDPRPAGSRPYRVPSDNPFRRRRGAKGAICAYGLRNPFRFSFDRATGDLLLADVGELDVEEVNFRPRSKLCGANFGWDRFEGTRRYSRGTAPGHIKPVIQRSHEDGWCAIIGGHVVRDPELPSLAGRYLYGDNCAKELRSARVFKRRAENDRELGLDVRGLSSFAEDNQGHIYITSLTGPVYRLVQR